MARHVIIVGGGVIGLCTAYDALRRGWRATIIDRGAPDGGGCSYGNAGLIVPSHFVPLAAPGMVALGLKWMLRPEAPFRIRPRASWDLVRWGWHFCRAATPLRAARAGPVLAELHRASLARYRELAAALPDDFGFTENGLLMLCRTDHGLHEEARAAAQARQLKMSAEIVDRRRLAELEPDLDIDARGGVYYPEDAHLDPVRLMRALQQHLAAAGVSFQWHTEARGWRTSGRNVAALVTGHGDVAADAFVLAGGAWSPELARPLGLDLPMQPGKGYSLTLLACPQRPRRGLICVEARLAVTPLADAVRFGGTMELAGLDTSINPARVRGILRAIPSYFPRLQEQDFANVTPWAGLRPCSPDGLPYLGRPRGWDNVIVAAGHAMLGVSLGPITGHLAGALLDGANPALDLHLLAPDRYAT